MIDYSGIRSATSAFLLGFTNCRKQRAPSRCFTTSLNPFFSVYYSYYPFPRWSLENSTFCPRFPPPLPSPLFSPKHKWRRRRRSYRKFHGKSWRWRASLRGNEDVQRLTIENNREAARAERYRVQGSRHKNLWPILGRGRRRKERRGRGAIYSDRLQTLRISIQAGKLFDSRNARNYGRWKKL